MKSSEIPVQLLEKAENAPGLHKRKVTFWRVSPGRSKPDVRGGRHLLAGVAKTESAAFASIGGADQGADVQSLVFRDHAHLPGRVQPAGHG
jgi:hypothetical protein